MDTAQTQEFFFNMHPHLSELMSSTSCSGKLQPLPVQLENFFVGNTLHSKNLKE
jgi:hypothetical protein